MVAKRIFFFIMLFGAIVNISKAQPPVTQPPQKPVTPPPPDNSIKVYELRGIPVTISEVLDLTVSPSNMLTFDFTSTNHIDAGIPQLAAQTLTFKSNKDYYITIKGIGASDYFSGGTEGVQMPLSMLKYKLSTSSEWIPLSATSQVLTGTATAKNLRGTGTIVVDFKMDPGYITHPAQDYSVTISYDIANQ